MKNSARAAVLLRELALLVEEGAEVNVGELAVHAIEEQPALARRLALVLRSLEPRRYMSVKEYAKHANVSERTVGIAIDSGMEEGRHYHRAGRTGRRVIMHVDEADAWFESRRFAKSDERTAHDSVTNEVLKRRALVALKKTTGER